jgi:acetyl-CoA hydrolase
MASSALKARVRRPAFWNKLHTPEELLHHFPAGAYIGWSGFTG